MTDLASAVAFLRNVLGSTGDIEEEAIGLFCSDVTRPGTLRWPLPGASWVAWTAGAAGLVLYNWWVLVPFRPGLLHSPNELFSDLEMPGQPFASAMRHADLLSGVLLMVAFLAVAGAGARARWGEWAGIMVSAAANAAGGVFPESCAEGISAVCRQRELSFSLAPGDYIHEVAGICEIAGVTVTLVLAYRRTRGDRTGAARTYRALACVALVAYPLMGLAYLTARLGAVIEPVLFVGFTIIVVTQLAERTASIGDGTRGKPRETVPSKIIQD